MPILIDKPARIESAGNKPKLIDEFFCRVRSGNEAVSIATNSLAAWLDRARPAALIR